MIISRNIIYIIYLSTKILQTEDRSSQVSSGMHNRLRWNFYFIISSYFWKFIYLFWASWRERERDPTTFSCRLFKIKLNHNSKNKPSKLFRLNFDSPPFFFFFFSINFFNNLVKFNQHPLYRRDKKDEERGTAFIPAEILARTFIVLNSLARRFVSPPRTSSDA